MGIAADWDPWGAFVGTAVGIMGTKAQRWDNRGARWRIARRPLVFQQGLQPSASDTVLSFQAEDLTVQPDNKGLQQCERLGTVPLTVNG